MFASLDCLIGNAYFAGLAAAALLCGTGVVMARHPLNAAVCLIGAMLAVAGIYSLLDSPFLAVLQVLVYAGAVMMLMVFVIMVLGRAREDALPRFDRWGVALALVPLALTALLVRTLLGQELPADPGALRGEPAVLAARLFDLYPAGPGWYLLFVAIGVVLLAAVVGAVLLAKRRLDGPAAAAEEEAHDHAH